MKVIFVSGKYRSDTERGLIQNIRHAEQEALWLWLQGWAVVCPHKNTAHFGGVLDDPEADHQLWMAGDLEILSRVDAIYMLLGFEKSEGAKLELELAIKLKKEVIYEV